MLLKLIFLWLLTMFLFSCSKKETPKEKSPDNLYLFNKAFDYRDKKQADSAFIYFYKAKDLFLIKKDSLGVAKSLINMAIILTEKGDYFGGQETSILATKYLDDNNQKHHYYLATNFNNLGIATTNLKDYNNSLKFYDLAIKLSTDSLDTRIYLNNKAKSYQAVKKYKEAIRIYNRILKQTNKNQEEYSRVLSNLAKTKWLQNPDYNAKPEFFKALNIRIKENDLWGQNASYAHLADYYSEKQPDSALYYALKMYTVAKKINSPNDQYEALQKLIKLSPSRETKIYFETYKNLGDSLETARNAAKNQFALIRYETEKNKADNLKLQKDNTEKKYQIIKQRILLISTFLLIVAGAVITVLWYKKRKQRLELEAKNVIRENQLKTSKKVHDVVANGLYRVMTEIENQDTLDRDNILDKLEVMYEKSRDISYDEVSFTGENFHGEILDLLKSFATDSIRVVYTGSTPDMWKDVSGEVKYEIHHILQELMVNMQKHSKASNVAIKFENRGNHIDIRYTDDGIGISKEMKFNNGLTNTGNRIKSINGTITFDTKSEKGFKIYISFPAC
jgi:tetratricopeptide (TPR) repeat protein